MQTVTEQFTARYEIKKSTFLAYLAPYREFETLKSALKSQHPKAAHIVWAYRTLNEFHQTVENGSDDGEPKGTSAPSVLNVMRGFELIEAAILVVRYFGGVKLGTGGLVRAYGSAAKSVLNIARLEEYEFKESFEFALKLSDTRKCEYFLEKNLIAAQSREFSADRASWRVIVTSAQKEKLLRFLETLI